jgi:sulfonate transport system ATP-binding protein
MAPRLVGRVAAAPAADRAALEPAYAHVARLRGVHRSFGERRVLDSLDLEIGAGEFVAMLGRSGSGKSTVLRAIAGLDTQVQGELEIGGTTAVAFQDARLVPWKPVLANVRLGLRRPGAEAVARSALEEVGLGDHLDAWPLTLSGGEAQRVSLARALVREPALLLLDEPFGALDALTRIAMHNLVVSLWDRHRPAVLFVTHDVDEALGLADRVVVLGSGRIAYQSRIDLDRPREREHPRLVELRLRLLRELDIDTKGATT